MKLNTIVKNNHVVGYGFKAIVDLSDLPASVDCKVDIAIVSSLSPAVMSEKRNLLLLRACIVTGNISPEELDSKRVAGTLPPHLIQYCAEYRAAVINDFDYSCDGDLTGEELKNRFKICDPITVVVKGLRQIFRCKRPASKSFRIFAREP